MKVYVKRKDKKSSMLFGIGFILFFLSISISVFITVFFRSKSSIENVLSYGIELLFAIVFFITSIYLIFALFKKPEGYKVVLVEKKVQVYKGKTITYMKFNQASGFETINKKKKRKWTDYACYTKGENDFIVNNTYILMIKEFDHNPRYICEINDGKIKYKEDTIKDYLASINYLWLIIKFILGGEVILCIIGLIKYPQYAAIYIIIGVFLSAGLFFISKKKK